jgi:hypothetical protein
MMLELIRRIAEVQHPDGGFESLSSPDPQDFSSGVPHRAVFSVSWILESLNRLPADEVLEKIRMRAAAFLIAERSAHGSVNYWPRTSEEARTTPYPDDLDDTFCAAMALQGAGSDFVDGEMLAKLVMLLTAVERQEGGPYRTWLVPPDAPEAWKDVDVAVNANIGAFLSRQGVELDPLNRFLSDVIRSETLRSPYYPSELPVIFFLSGWFPENDARIRLREILERFVESRIESVNPLELSLMGLALLNLAKERTYIEQIAARISALSIEHIWKPFAFCIDPSRDGKTHYAGSTPLTAAFVLAFQTEYARRSSSASQTGSIPAEENGIAVRVREMILARLAELSEDLRSAAEETYEEVTIHDPHAHIPQLPAFVARSLDGGERASKDLLIQLGAATVYGWMAYTIYDDVLDDEDGARSLSAANVCLREFTRIFHEAFPKTSSTFMRIIDRIDGANQWEFTHARGHVVNGQFEIAQLPDYGDRSTLADRSLGHALGPLAVLSALGYGDDAPETQNLLAFFRHYLIARQMNDDAHDWQEDLKRGQVNSVAAVILRACRADTDEPFRFELARMGELEHFFWHSLAPDLTGEILGHVTAARKALDATPIIRDRTFFEAMLAPVEKAAMDAQTQQRETLRFLKAYGE